MFLDYRFKDVLILLIVFFFISCKSQNENRKLEIWKSIEVNASAYNSVRYQTSGTPNIAAWGDTLKPGMKCIAVSRDLLEKGIAHNTRVKISGLDGIYLVKDKMNKRWKNKIDIYMGNDIKKARNWGTKKVMMEYAVKPEENQTAPE
ncbi:hypothetical protein [uncultured Eudoraea sp.]|uniref:3D domain-containing protein n=1 Tax=uncultured Eudoraea sp. TaxID=1035614 RepID=UPI00260641AA|nr:hypothetical protein [uncultured Eudoraea sp.]